MPEDPASPLSEQSTLDQRAPSSAGTFGRYRLLQKLGEGGMGEVWLAEQTEPVQRKVALKVIKAGMDSAQVVARFEAERQALALMDHPAIASVYDGGTTPQGRPYFAMEYFRGEPITTYCDRQRLSTTARLELFIRVCEGVQHAHQKGIIHRDLKPSNILVTLQDDHPTPKVIDFGVAKAIARPLTERALYTELGALIGTPEYMSPEQAEMSGLDVDTRTDVYALGVLLYELLTGTLPFDSKELRQGGLGEIQRIIREKEPSRPSTRITPPGLASTAAAQNRQTEPRRLASELRGDLDWITMRALEKDRTRRYQTANALAADVRRHLDDEPVIAGPPSAAYRAGKFVRRHRFGVAAAATLALLLLGFAVTMAVQARRIALERNRANQEAETARQVSSFLVSLFEASKPGTRSPDSLTARELLDAGAERIDRELGGQPLVRATLQMTIGEAYWSLGIDPKAAGQYAQALELRRQALGRRHPDVGQSLSAVAATTDSPSERERLLREALEMQRALPGVNADDLVWTLIRLSSALSEQGRHAEAETCAREGLRLARSNHPRPHAIVARAWERLGAALVENGEPGAGTEALQAALQTALAIYGPRHRTTWGARERLANAQLAKGEYAEAEASYREILELQGPVLGAQHPDRGRTLGNLGAALYLQKKYEEAVAVDREALDVTRRAFGESHPRVAICLSNLGQALDAQGEANEARAALSRAIAIDRAAYGPDSPNAAVTLVYLSDNRRHAGQHREAERHAREALAIDGSKLGPDHPRTKEASGALGRALAKQRRWDEAEPLLLAYAAALEATSGVEGDLGEVTQEIAEMYEARGQPAKAGEWRARRDADRPGR